MKISGILFADGFVFSGCLIALMFSIGPTKFAEAAAPPDTVADVHCLIVGTRLAASPDERQKLSGTMLVLYFLGRIDGRSPTVNLQELLVQEAKGMSVTELKGAATRCGTELSLRGAEITRIGQGLEKLGKRGVGGGTTK